MRLNLHKFPTANMVFADYSNDALVEHAKEIAFKAHRQTNHWYDEDEHILYEEHLEWTVRVAKRFLQHLPRNVQNKIYIALYLHDSIEDTRISFNDVQKRVGYGAALIVFGLTNNRGRNRKERADKDYYDTMFAIDYVPLAKVCDRTANMEYGYMMKNHQFKMNCKELPSFLESIRATEYIPKEMIDHLTKMAAGEQVVTSYKPKKAPWKRILINYFLK